MSASAGSIIALAGRRIDAADVPAAAFPLERVAAVAQRLRVLFESVGAETLVCSAANGADLTALRVARELGMRRRIILPFAAARFRRVSVTDRPGGELWGWIFDDAIADARATDDLVVLRAARAGSAGYEAANARIVEEAVRIAATADTDARTLMGVIVWEGAPHGGDDATAGFRDRLQRAGIPVRSVRTGAR